MSAKFESGGVVGAFFIVDSFNGPAGGRRWGLEFSGIAVVDLEDKTALHLEAVQTIDKADQESLLDYYSAFA